MPHGTNTPGFGGGGPGRSNFFSRGLSLGTFYQARGGEADSDSSDDVDDKEDEGKDVKIGKKGSRRGSQV